jgi:hypothetical protein
MMLSGWLRVCHQYGARRWRSFHLVMLSLNNATDDGGGGCGSERRFVLC